MKRSEAIKLLMSKVISPFEVIKLEYYEIGLYKQRAENLLEFIEKELKMKPPFSSEVYQKDSAKYIFADGNQWEPEE